MFLDEELEQIFQEEGLTKECASKIWKACVNRLPDLNKVSDREYITVVKQVDNGYRLFAKRHPEFIIDGFRALVIKAMPGTEEEVKRILNW